MSNIVLFIDSLGAGGAQRQLVGLALMLKERGIDVKVCTYFNFDFYKHHLDENNIPNIVIKDASSTKKRIIAIRNYLIKENPDYVIAYQETPSLVACFAKLLGGKFKLIVSERNTTQKVVFADRIRFLLYKCADAIVPNSYAQERFIAEYKPGLLKKVTTIVNFVDTELFCPLTRKENNAKIRIVVAATVSQSKNTIPFIHAVNVVKKRGFNNFVVEWYGEVDTNKHRCVECNKIINDLGLNDVFIIKRKTQDILSVYREADLFCLPSLFEGTPNALAEAMSCGLPVIVSDVCDNALYVRKKENGFLFDPTSIDSMAQGVIEAISTDKKNLESYGKRSREIAVEKFSKKTFIESYLKIINS